MLVGASDEDRARMVETLDGDLSVDYMISTTLKTIESNLSIMMGNGRTVPLDPKLEHRYFGKKDAMPKISPDISISV